MWMLYIFIIYQIDAYRYIVCFVLYCPWLCHHLKTGKCFDFAGSSLLSIPIEVSLDDAATRLSEEFDSSLGELFFLVGGW